MLFTRFQCYPNIYVFNLSILGFNIKSMYFYINSTIFNRYMNNIDIILETNIAVH